LLFLDVDGVLNSQVTRTIGDDGTWSDAPAPELLGRVRLIVDRTGAEVVLSSTWRLEEAKRREVEEALEAQGVRIVGATPDHTVFGDRVDEIMAWLQASRALACPWVAIDDMDLVAMNEQLEERHFVRTDDAVGLTSEKAAEAVEKLLGRSAAATSELPAAAAPSEAAAAAAPAAVMAAVPSPPQPSAGPPLPPVVFLDVDGVLNSRQSRRRLGGDAPALEAMENLRCIVDKMGAEVVLSSNWRLLDAKLGQVERALAAVDLHLAGTTPDLDGSGSRVDEILTWLEGHGGAASRPWVALDDLDLLTMSTRMRRNNFVHVNSDVGLSSNNASEAVSKLILSELQ